MRLEESFTKVRSLQEISDCTSLEELKKATTALVHLYYATKQMLMAEMLKQLPTRKEIEQQAADSLASQQRIAN
jgi:hypothetical protein